MLKCIVKLAYKRRVDSNIIDIFSNYFKYEIGIELFLNIRIILYYIICIIAVTYLYYNDKIITSYIIFGANILLLLYFLRDCYKKKLLETPNYIMRSYKITKWIIGHYIFKKQFLIKEKWNAVKKTDRHLYYSLLSGYSIGRCHDYALDLALQIDNAILVYAGISNPICKSRKACAHAFVIRNREVFDTNQRRSFNVDDYYKLFNVKVYNLWNYSEYSEPNFKEKVSKDFHKWCKDNNVSTYKYF